MTDSWSEQKILHGQNDYIDILGSDDLHPTDIMYNVPFYLRGVHRATKHHQVAMLRRDAYERTPFAKTYPTKWLDWNAQVKMAVISFDLF